jgi:type IV secretion system protein VirB5
MSAFELPFDQAKGHWNGREKQMHAVIRSYQWMLGGMFVVMAGSLSAAVWLATQSRFIPYVVQTDQLGQVQAIRVADRASPADDRIKQAFVATFIHNARMVTVDGAMAKKAVNDVYHYMKREDPALAKMNAFYKASDQANPLVRARTETVDANIVSVLPQTDPDPAHLDQQVYRVEWVETVYDRSGSVKVAPVRWNALLTVYQESLTATYTAEQIIANPIGLYVKDFSWNQQL